MDTSTNRLDPTNDLLFKKMLASPDHPEVLRGFIKDFFGFEPEEITLENPYSIETYREYWTGMESNVLRETFADVRASLKTASFTAEMQVNKAAFFDERALYYVCDAYCGNYNRSGGTGESRYGTLVPVYAMNILKHTTFSDDRALRTFGLIDKNTGERMRGDMLNIAYFELTKESELTQNQLYWRALFMGEKLSKEAPPYLHEAAGIVDYVNLNKEERIMYDAAEKAIATHEAVMLYARNEGRAEGRVEGRAEAVFLAAQKMYRRRIKIEDIKSDFPELSSEQLRAIQEETTIAPTDRGIMDSLEEKKRQAAAQDTTPGSTVPEH